MLTGQQAGFHRVCSSTSPDLERGSGSQAQVVLQDVRQGRERQVGQTGGEAAHQGKTRHFRYQQFII